MKKFHLTDVIVVAALILLGVWFVRSIPHNVSAKNSALQAETTSQLSPAVTDGQPSAATAQGASTPNNANNAPVSDSIAPAALEANSTPETPQTPAFVPEDATYSTPSDSSAGNGTNTNTTSQVVSF